MNETTFWHVSEVTVGAANGDAVGQIQRNSTPQTIETERPHHERDVESH